MSFKPSGKEREKLQKELDVAIRERNTLIERLRRTKDVRERAALLSKIRTVDHKIVIINKSLEGFPFEVIIRRHITSPTEAQLKAWLEGRERLKRYWEKKKQQK